MMESWIGGQKRSLTSLLLMEAHQARLHQTHRTFPMMMTMMLDYDGKDNDDGSLPYQFQFLVMAIRTTPIRSTKSQSPNLPKQRLKAEKSEKGELKSVELHLKEAPCIIEVGAAGPAAELSPYYSLPIATLPSQARGLWTKTNFPCSDNFQNWQA